jgi:hypothetical protein
MRLFQTATGTLILGEKSIPLKFAYAFERPNDEALPPKVELRLLLTDQPVPLEAQESTFGLYPLQQDGKFVGVDFLFDQKEPDRNFSGHLFPAPPQPPSSFSLSNKKYFTELKLTGGVVAGKVASEESRAPSPEGESLLYRYEASFSAPIRKAPAVTKILQGKAAQAHALVPVIARYFAAVRKGDYPAMQKLVSKGTLVAWARLEKQIGAAEYRRQLVEFGKMVEFNPKTITHLVLRGEQATVVSKIKGGKDIATLRREDGVWKLHIP